MLAEFVLNLVFHNFDPTFLPFQLFTMKRTLTYTFSLVAILMVFAACGKYEEGPGISLRSKKARVVGEWKVTELTLNGTNTMTDGSTTELDITEDKFTTRNITAAGSVSVTADWEFDDKKEHIVATYTNNGTTTTERWEILRLANKEMKLKYVQTVSGVEYTTLMTAEAR